MIRSIHTLHVARAWWTTKVQLEAMWPTQNIWLSHKLRYSQLKLAELFIYNTIVMSHIATIIRAIRKSPKNTVRMVRMKTDKVIRRTHFQMPQKRSQRSVLTMLTCFVVNSKWNYRIDILIKTYLLHKSKKFSPAITEIRFTMFALFSDWLFQTIMCWRIGFQQNVLCGT